MLLEGRAREGVGSRVRWQQGDAQALSFDDASFDVVTCQFGVMFLDREAAYAEACRVLRPHGTFAFNVWDAIEHNEYAEAVTDALAAAAPAGSVQFLRRTPHGYHDPDRIRADLTHAGFSVLSLEHHDGTSTGTPLDVALAYCRGTPLSGEIERHPDLDLDSATRIARDALEQRYGAGPTAAQTRWLQVLAVRPG
jgi:SAM-dependent methyltransferase